MSFDCDLGRFADFELIRMSGQPCLGAFGLLAHGRFKVSAFPNLKAEHLPTLVETEADLRISREGNGEQYFVGRLRPSHAPVEIKGLPYAQDSTVYFFIELNIHQMESIEKIRMGGNIVFDMQVRARIRRCSELGQQDRIGGEQSSTRLNAGTWIEVLHELKYKDIMLIEVPIGLESDHLALPIDRLRKAQAAFERGDWREAVGLCRNALETLETVLGDGNIPEQPNKEKTKEDRYRHWRKSLMPLIHSAKHDDKITDKFIWDRQDAIAAITTIAALLQRYKSL